MIFENLNTSKFTVAAEGVYTFKVVGAEIKKTTKGSEFFSLKYEATSLDGDKHKGNIFDTIFVGGQFNEFKLYNLIVATGLESVVAGKGEIPEKELCKFLVGGEFCAKLAIEERDGKKNNRIDTNTEAIYYSLDRMEELIDGEAPVKEEEPESLEDLANDAISDGDSEY